MSDEGKHQGGSSGSKPLLKLVIEYGPLFAFVTTYYIAGFFWATGVIMVASVVALTASRLLFGRLLPVPLVTAVLVLIFGALTLYLDDPRFFKVKPTVINLLFAGALLFGLWTERPLLKMFLGDAFKLTDAGWRILTTRWALFFVCLAALNEVVWRNFSEAVWVNFKFFGILLLTFAFAMAQMGLIKRHESPDAEAKGVQQDA
jgi:intracellular septation protein